MIGFGGETYTASADFGKPVGARPGAAVAAGARASASPSSTAKKGSHQS